MSDRVADLRMPSAKLPRATAAEERRDVIVVGGGNAGLCAAISARHHAERVLLLERAPVEMRGGNTRHTRNIRCVHDRADEYTTEAYTEEELLADLLQVGGGAVDIELARLTIRESATHVAWMEEHGVRWQQALRGTLQLSRTNRFFLGGGKALVNSYYRTAERMGVEVRYDTRVEDLVMDGDTCVSLLVRRGQTCSEVPARAFVLAAGGFEANIDWLKRYWGEAAENYAVRGTPYNDGRVLDALMRHGARTVGDPRQFHAVAVDARGPRFDGGIATRVDSLPFGIVVNREGRRFYDEGEDLWPKRYAIWGGLIARQPGQVAYSIFDSRVAGRFIPPLFEPHASDTIAGLAERLGLDAGAVEATIEEFNCAARSGGRLDESRLDGLATTGLQPPKSNWAQPIDRPPFYGIPLRSGLTFTYMGVAVDAAARVQRQGGAFSNLFAAGEIMSGNILSSGYLGGFGLTIGTTFGRIAGREAAAHAD